MTTQTSQTTGSTTRADHDVPMANPARAERMQAVTQDRYGDSSVLQISTVDRPRIEADEVLIEVQAAGLDRGTEHLMTGTPYLIRIAGFGFTKPKQQTPGLDVAGTVVAVGDDVSRFSVGDEVFGIARGSFAEFAAAKESKLSLKPAALDFVHAAVSTVSGITALQALTDVGDVQPGQRVLVIGASGGVGSFAVQLATALGATVDGVAGARNADLVRSLGAEQVFDHRTTDLTDIRGGYDLVLDIGGRNPLRKLRSVLAPTGTLVIVGGENGNRITGGVGRQLRAVALSPFVTQRLTTFMSSERHDSIDRLAEFLASGVVVPVVGRTFDLGDAAEALRELAAGRLSGKTAIVVGAERSER